MKEKEVIKNFEIYKKGISRLKELENQLDKLDTRNFKKESKQGVCNTQTIWAAAKELFIFLTRSRKNTQTLRGNLGGNICSLPFGQAAIHAVASVAAITCMLTAFQRRSALRFSPPVSINPQHLTRFGIPLRPTSWRRVLTFAPSSNCWVIRMSRRP